MDSKLKQWRDDQKHLPEFMRDFHECKRLFKGISDYIELEDDHPAKEVNWRQAHCYTIDVFLWFMARHGFTLQRSRARQDFDDLDALLEELDKLRRQAFTDAMQRQGAHVTPLMLSQGITTAPSPAHPSSES